MSSLMEAILGDMPINKTQWNNRTVDSVSDAIIESISNHKGVCGINHNTKPREVLLARRVEQNPEFKEALSIVAANVLEMFPNPVETTAEKN